MPSNARRQEVRKITDEEQLHREILDAFHAYFKANFRWQAKKTLAACVQTRVLLSEIRHLCNQRRIILNNWKNDPTTKKWKRNKYSFEKKSDSKGDGEQE